MSDQGFELDIDRERVRLEGEWLAVADIAERIRKKIESGDFRVSRLSLALEALEAALSDLHPVTVKVTPELIETYERIARHEDVPVGQVLRRGLVAWLASEEAAGRLFEASRARNGDANTTATFTEVKALRLTGGPRQDD